MPTRINGIGTAYHGKSNLQAFDGVCQHCHRGGKLENYETRLWFTVLYIPLIPLTKQQIINHCRSCTWHSAIPFGEWERLRENAVETSAAKWSEKRDDPAAAMELHSTLAAFHQRTEADRLAKLLLEQFADNAKVQFYVGRWYERTGMNEAADACFARALKLEPQNLAARRAVAIGHVEQGRLEEAHSLLKAFEPPSEAFEPGAFYLLAKAFQAQDQHREALDILLMLLGAVPGLSSDKEFRQRVRRSERALGIESSVVPVDPLYRSPTVLVTAAVAAALVAVAIWNMYVERHRTVHVLNGLPTPITVAIDGSETIAVPARGRATVNLAEGKHAAEVTEPCGDGPPLEFTLESGWLDRFFKNPAYVIDPGRSSVVVWESVEYAEHPQAGQGDSFRWSLGQPYISYSDVDYLFEEFPQQIALKKSKRTVTKTRLGTLPLDPVAAVTAKLSDGAVETLDALPFVEAHLRGDPRHPMLVMVYYSLAMASQQQDRCRDFLALRLGERPVLVEWHRVYQGLREAQGANAELVRQYDNYLKTEPENSTLLYLRGRVEIDDPRAQAFYDRARATDPSNPYPWYAQAYRRQAAGDFVEARKGFAEACRLNPEDPMMRASFEESRFACGEFDGIAAELRQELAKEPQSLSTHVQLLEALAAAGLGDQAETAQREFAAKVATDKQDAHQLALTAQLHLLYLQGRFDDLLTGAQQLQDQRAAATFRFEGCLESGRLEDLTSEGISTKLRPQYLDLLLSLGWSRRGDRTRADAARQRAIDQLETGPREERNAAALLRQGAEAPAGAAHALLLEPAAKVIVIAALAEICPPQRADLLLLAEKLNYRRDFPCHFLKSTIDSLRQPISQ